MGEKNKPEKIASRERITVIALSGASCAVGAIAASLGGPVAAAIAVACACAGTFAFFLAGDALRARAATAATGAPSSEIPSDRIDPLTGLANENGLMAWLKEKSDRIARDGKGIIVLAADLAEFERIEKTYPPEIVDSVLKEVARRVSTCTGADGIAARTSGDEFAAIATVVPARSSEAAEEQAGKLAELIQRPVELPTGVVWIGGSVGASWGEVSDGAEILRVAREALKKASALGRGHYVVHGYGTAK